MTITYKVNVVRLQVLQTRLETDVHALGTRPAVVALMDGGSKGVIEWASVLGGEDDFISPPMLLHPFPEPLLRLPGLVVHGSVNEVAALFIKVVQHFKGGLFAAFAQERLPGLAEIHCTET